MAEISKERFIRDFSKEIEYGSAALFVGAGMSVRSGMVDWRGLLREIAQDLGLDVDEETDLIALAQYEYNSRKSRHRLNTAIIEEFTKRAELSEAHKKLARLPLGLVWTTNYDKLIEKSYEAIEKRVDVKYDIDQLALRPRDVNVTIYKMHGDVDHPDRAILTKDDYERYDIEKHAFTELLRTDLIRQSFLFIGFSFTDPNIEYILSRLRIILGNKNRDHYCVMRRPEPPASKRKGLRDKYKRDFARFRHRIDDLQRFGIHTVAVDQHLEIDPILQELVNRSIAKNVFISGSAHDYNPLGRDKLESLARLLGKELIVRGYRLITGYGLGIGGACILGAYEAANSKGSTLPGKSLLLRVFPQDIKVAAQRAQTYKKIRNEIMEQSSAVVFLSGNKVAPASGNTVLADGMIEEFDIAKQHQRVLIPVAATGHVASKIWEEIEPKLNALYPSGAKKHFAILSDVKATEKQIIEAIFGVLEETETKRKKS